MTQKKFVHRLIALAIATGLTVIVTAQDSGIIKEIVIRGNKRVSSQAIKSTLRVREGQILNLNALDEDRSNVMDMGWFSKVSYNRSLLNDNTWQVTFDVAEYDVVREVAVLGNTGVKTEDILKAVTFLPVPGTKLEDLKPFNQKEIKATSEAIQRLYAEKGMLALVSSVAPAPSSPTTIYINVQETIVNSITIEGLTNTKKRVFDRLIKTKPGQIYNRTQWEKDFFTIVNTQWFEGITPNITDEQNGLLDLKIKLNDARTGQFNAGVALDPRNSLAGMLSYADTNFKGTGQNLSFNFTQPTVNVGGSIRLDYTNPFFDRKDTTVRLSVYDQVQFRFANNFGGGGGGTITDNQYSERRTGSSIATSRPVSDKLSLGLTARFERINVPNDLQPIPGQNFIQQDGEVGVLSFTSVFNTRDIDFDPSKGKFVRFDLEPGFSVIRPQGTITPGTPEGRFGFLRLGFDYRTYFTKDKRPRTTQDQSREVFAFRLRGGTIQGTVPFFEQYFAGGNDSVRGYFEDRFWGTSSLVATMEWRRPIQDSFSLVTFVDYGGAWGGYGTINDFTQTQKLRMRLGYGIGLRLRTPIGPVRLDFAFNGEGGSRPHFAIGTNF